MADSQQIPKSMHAWRKHKGNSEAVYEEVAVPSTPSDGFLVKILAAGVCHSDVGIVERDNPNFQEKFVIGHEGCGEIVDIGENVKENQGWKLGQRVAINPVAGCGENECPDCKNDLMQLCERGLRHGLGHDGSFAEYVAISARSAVKVPDGVTDPEAAVSTGKNSWVEGSPRPETLFCRCLRRMLTLLLICFADAIMTSHHAIVRRGQIKASDTVFVFGL